MARRLDELQRLREGATVERRPEPVGLAEMVRRHLVATKLAGQVTDEWILATEKFLQRAIDYFGQQRRVDAIKRKEIIEWSQSLATIETNRGKPLTRSSVRHHLNAMSRLFRRAQEQEVIAVGCNPVAALLEKPQKLQSDAIFLEIDEAALYLEAARTLPPATCNPHSLHGLMAGALVGSFLLTGARHDELLGLELDDVSFDRRTIHFRPNQWRRLKNRHSKRVVPLWPQLEELLRTYIIEVRVRQPGTLLFPSFESGQERMFTDVRKLLDRVSVRSGFLRPRLDPTTGDQKRNGRGELDWEGQRIRSRIFRHTYCSARLQTLDRGEPVGVYTVRREMGHSSDDMVNGVYAHLGDIRHRSDVVEYQVAQHLDALADRMKALSLALP